MKKTLLLSVMATGILFANADNSTKNALDLYQESMQNKVAEKSARIYIQAQQSVMIKKTETKKDKKEEALSHIRAYEDYYKRRGLTLKDVMTSKQVNTLLKYVASL